MKCITPALVALVMIGTASFTQTENPKPVSSYMRHVGLLYVEQVETLELSTSCGDVLTCDARSVWETGLNGLEDRINISLSESKSPAGDKPYFDLLKTVRYARAMYTLAYYQKDNTKGWMDAYVYCYSAAHSVALDGEYVGRADCDDRIDNAVHPDNVQNKKDAATAATAKMCDKGVFDKAYCDDYWKTHTKPKPPASKEAQH